jgi:signal transduction histidine kinase
MKLFAKYNRVTVVSTVIIFLLGCVAFSLLITYVVISQVDEDLKIEKDEIVTYVNKYDHLPAVVEVHDQYTNYFQILKQEITGYEIFTHEGYDTVEQNKELQRTIEFNINTTDKWYKVTVSKSLGETNELIQTIIAITIILVLLILGVTFIINRIVLRKLWQPFYNTLEKTHRFDLNSAQRLNFDTTNIDEFNYLNSTLTDTFFKAQNDYKTLKEFTENASHEMQTPLAVIQSKLDLLIQNEKLSEAESHAIQGAYTSLQSLSRLNQSLLLLAKIENNQFSKQTTINLKELLQNKFNQFSELWNNKGLTVATDLHEKNITGNEYLIEILVNNLLSNATKHNISEGTISILLNDKLQVTNSGVQHSLDEKKLYQRFSKQTNTNENQGLGLSIIQQICITSGYNCTYYYEEPDLHSFIINFN